MKIICQLLLIFILLVLPNISSSANIPNACLRVTVQQKQNGKINKGYHVFELSCLEGNCSLSSISLNQCFESGSYKQAFYPKVQYSFTRTGDLKVKNEGNSFIVEETGSDMFGDYVNNLRFDYEAVKEDKIVNRLIGFSGGYVKSSQLLKEIITAEYVPLPKANQVIKLDCNVLLPGIDKK